MKKRILAIVLALFVSITVLPVSASAGTIMGGIQFPVKTDEDLDAALTFIDSSNIGKAHIVLEADGITVSDPFQLKNVILDTNGHELTVCDTLTLLGTSTITGGGILIRGNSFNGRMLTVPSGATAILDDITLDGGAVWSGEENAYIGRGTENAGITAAGALLYVEGTVTLQNETVVQNNDWSAANDGGSAAICVDNNGALHISDAIIRNNYGSNWGSAIYGGGRQSNSTIQIDTVDIYGNDGKDGTVFTFRKMTLGTPESTSNTATTIRVHDNVSGNGAGIRGATGNTIAIYNGQISHNTAYSGGAGIFTYRGNMKIYGADISYNEVLDAEVSSGKIYNSGGGIYADLGSGYSLVLYDGQIHDNISPVNGGGIFLAGNMYGALTMHGGKVYENRALGTGGGVFAGWPYAFLMDGEVTGNFIGGESDKNDVTLGRGTFGGTTLDAARLTVQEENTRYGKIEFSGFGSTPIRMEIDAWDTLDWTGATNVSISKSAAASADAILSNITWVDKECTMTLHTDDLRFYLNDPTPVPQDQLPVGVQDYSGTYDGQPHSFTLSTVNDAAVEYYEDAAHEQQYKDGQPSFTDAGTYTVYYTVKKEAYQEVNGSAVVTIAKKSIAKPTAIADLYADGTEITGVRYLGDAEYSVDGKTSAETAGTYSATFTLQDPGNTQWSGGSTDPLVVAWELKAEKTPVTITFAEKEVTTVYSENGSYTQAAEVTGLDDSSEIIYSVNKAYVASADSLEPGKINLLKTGYIVVTASYVGDETHTAASASYSLLIAAAEDGQKAESYVSSVTLLDGRIIQFPEPILAIAGEEITIPYGSTLYDNSGNAQTLIGRTVYPNGTADLQFASHSSSSTRYTVTVENAQNGGVISSHQTAKRGNTVTLTVTPDKNYRLDIITVKDVTGKTVKVTNNGNGKYTFSMPANNVTVKVSFVKETIFADIPSGAYYEDAVDWAMKNSTVNGVSSTAFDPDGICTRAQAVTFLWRTAGNPEPESTKMPFVDVSVDSYYYKAVLWAVENGITKGTSDTTFSPDMTCNRGHIVTFLWRTAKSPTSGSTNPFVDVPANTYYTDAVLWAVENGVTRGTTDTAFSPAQGCTRAQIVTFIYRQYNK